MKREQGSNSGMKLPVVIVGVVAAASLASPEVNAMTAPAAGSFGYDFYDVAVNDMLKGAPGFVAGVGFIGYGATQLMKSWWVTVLAVLGGSGLIKADSLVTSLGALV